MWLDLNISYNCVQPPYVTRKLQFVIFICFLLAMPAQGEPVQNEKVTWAMSAWLVACRNKNRLSATQNIAAKSLSASSLFF